MRRFSQIPQSIENISRREILSGRVFDDFNHSAERVRDAFTLLTSLVSYLFGDADGSANRNSVIGFYFRAVLQNHLNDAARLVVNVRRPILGFAGSERIADAQDATIAIKFFYHKNVALSVNFFSFVSPP